MTYYVLENGIGEASENMDGEIVYPGRAFHVVTIVWSGHGWNDTPALVHKVRCANMESAQIAIEHFKAIDRLWNAGNRGVT